MASPEELLTDAEREEERLGERLQRGDFEYACFHAQQCAELAFKALLTRYGNYVLEHDLLRLHERARRRMGIIVEVAPEELAELTKHYTAARYRNARRLYGVVYSRPLAERCAETARKVLREVKKSLAA